MYRFFLRDGTWWVAAILFAAEWTIRVTLGIRVILRRGTVGYTLAWLSVILFVPLLGAFLYLLFGERRLGSRRAKRMAELREPYRQWLEGLAAHFPAAPDTDDHTGINLRRLARGTWGIPALPGNSLELMDSAATFFQRLITDIDAAGSSVHLEFYIWQTGGRADEVHAALIRAAARGVACRVLVDDAGSSEFVSSNAVETLRKAGVRVVSMLEVGMVRAVFERIDLRNHRKIAVIDGAIGYTGSQNLADPAVLENQTEHGEWIDAMVRLTGPAVEVLQVTLLADWEFETFEGLDKVADKFDLKRNAATGSAVVQVVPSGPGLAISAIQELVLMAIYGADHELVLTTPYFIPDEAMMKALASAAARGVDVRLVVPRRADSHVVRLAGEAFFEELLEAGVKIARFEGGVLHTKAITVDGEVAMFGSVNLDMRSFHLNFEISLLVYSTEFAGRVRALQERYIASSKFLDAAGWQSRPVLLRFVQQSARLLSPLL